jgi:hypothetical protein
MVKHTQVLLWILGYLIDESLMSMFVYTSVRIAYWADITVVPLGLFLWIFAFFTSPAIPFSFQWPLTLIFSGGQIFLNYWFTGDLRKWYFYYGRHPD